MNASRPVSLPLSLLLSLAGAAACYDPDALPPIEDTVPPDAAGSADGALPDAPPDARPIRSLAFDGVDDLVRVTGDAALEGWDDVTIEAWLKPTWAGAEARTALGKLRTSATHELSLRVDGAGAGAATGRMVFGFACGNFTGTRSTAATAIPKDAWTHVAITFDAPEGAGNAALRLYVNAQLVDESLFASATCIGSSLNDLLIGARPEAGAPSEPWAGGIADVRIWSVVRTQAEIRDGLATPPVGDEPGLVAAWAAADGALDHLRDRAPAANHGRLGASSAADPADPAWSLDVPSLPE